MLITAMQTPALSKISYFSLLFFRIIRFCLLEYVQNFELNFEQLPAVMAETFFAVPGRNLFRSTDIRLPIKVLSSVSFS